MRIQFLLLAVLITCISVSANAKKVTGYLPNHIFLEDIETPEKHLGFELGERHIRHDQLVQYMEKVAEQSNRVLLTDIGFTQEMRRQVLVTISSEENLKRLPALLQQKNKGDSENDPVVVWLGYSVHGDEISGANASLAVAYYLAASQNKAVKDMLADTVIVLEPSVNPDGMDRFTNWVNMHRGTTPNADPNHIEHHQGWRSGRTNHFGFDLNRDWLLLSQKESRNRIPYFHQYQPHVLGDFHEMGANSSFFFQPGIPTRTHPLTPKRNTELTQLMATFHSAALDAENRLYYSQENFDDFYYGKGSTYPDINGGVGILFEQASSRGYQQQSINGLLTFEYGVKNQVLTSLSTIQGAWKNKETFKQYRAKFYDDAMQAAKDEKINGYIISEAHDTQRLNHFLDKLALHQIDVYPLTKDYRLNDKTYPKGASFYVPLAQKQYRVIQALFSQGTNFQDNTFYDVSGWTMPLAMDIDFAPVKRSRGLALAKNTWQQQQATIESIAPNAYAYAFEWHHMYSAKLLNNLLNNGIKARVATKPFASTISGKVQQFSPGTIVIPAGIQDAHQWRDLVAQLSKDTGIEMFNIATGLTIQGIDLGSRSMHALSPVKPLLVGGKGSSQYEAAELRFYFDDMLNIPLTVVEQARLSRIDLADYTHVFFVDGYYKGLSKQFIEGMKRWLSNGGTVFAQKRAAQWLAKQEILKVKMVEKSVINDLFSTDGLTYQDKESLSARKRIAGAIFESTLDLSHPLTYGFLNDGLPMFKNSTLIMEPADAVFNTVASFSPTPLMSGYTDSNLVNKIASSPALVAHNYGRGRVIATPNVFAFRGYWMGSARLLSNSLFFSKAFSASAN